MIKEGGAAATATKKNYPIESKYYWNSSGDSNFNHHCVKDVIFSAKPADHKAVSVSLFPVVVRATPPA